MTDPAADSAPPKSILITGAGAGIGRATAQAFLDAGWRVALMGRRGRDVPPSRRCLGGGGLAAGRPNPVC